MAGLMPTAGMTATTDVPAYVEVVPGGYAEVTVAVREDNVLFCVLRRESATVVCMQFFKMSKEGTPLLKLINVTVIDVEDA